MVQSTYMNIGDLKLPAKSPERIVVDLLLTKKNSTMIELHMFLEK